MAAVTTGNEYAVKLLINYGADINMRSINSGMTALMMAVVEEQLEIVKILIENGADVNAKLDNGQPLLGMTENEEIRSYLLGVKEKE